MSDRPITDRGTETKARVNQGRRHLHREIFFAHNGPGPYECFHCCTAVDFYEVTVHHIDDNHDNNNPVNLTAMHNGCHRQYHAAKRVGVKRGPNKKRDYVHTPEHRANIAEGQRRRYQREDEQKNLELPK